ncbi:MAG: mechanosensitive ion channel protein MscS [Gammaproteobacteria bacterium]|nr:MAG: mechanosensitive ion channel protein MscS [Pseudomonadota bacterium]PIE38497.1 MAG: mechanosensitive ion channel protein MscS [Gammaproteobacteria bacterium]
MEDIVTTGQDKLAEILNWLTTMAKTYGPNLLMAIFTLVIGLWIINRLVKAVEKGLSSKVEATLLSFLRSLISVGLKVMLIISVASMVGIQTTSFIAVLGAAGLAVGLALQGSLANFAGGALILLFKPFKVGDVIDAQGFVGTVREIQIFNTILTTGDNRRVIIPNGALSNGSLINISAESTRRIDLSFGIGYNDDIDKAKAILNRLADEDKRILQTPARQIVVAELADSSVNFTVRLWANASDYWGIYFDMTENVKKAFDAEGISIPFPQQDVYMHKVS